jgi:hypothetical protein
MVLYTDISCLGGVFFDFATSVSVKGKNGKYDCYIKRTTDNVLQILLQALGEG